MTDLSDPQPSEQVRRYLQSSPPWTVSWSDTRALRQQARDEALAVRGELEPMHSVQTVDADGVACRLYLPSGSEQSVLVWTHGGGWIFGDLDGYDAVARALANRAKCAVLSVDYRLAPEHPFPAGLEDAWTATRWSSRSFSHVAVGGDSSGGNLAAAVALKARDEHLDLALQLLVYPVLDSATDTAFKKQFADRYENFAGIAEYGSTGYDRINFIWQTYLSDRSHWHSPYASPLQAPSLRDLAPAVVVIAEHDILRGEVEAYVVRLRAAAVPVEVQHYAGQIHGFFQMLGVMADARTAVDHVAGSLHAAFETFPCPPTTKE